MMTRSECSSSKILKNHDYEFNTEINDIKYNEFHSEYSNHVYQNLEMWVHPINQLELRNNALIEDEIEKQYNPFDNLSEPLLSSNSTNFCRICGRECLQVTALFSDNEKDDGGLSLADKINFCLPIKVTSQDALSKYICFECVKHVEDCHKLFLLCMQTEKLLLARLKFIKTLREDQCTLKCPVCPGIMQEKIEIDFSNLEFTNLSQDIQLKNSKLNFIESEAGFSVEFLQNNNAIKENNAIIHEEAVCNREINDIILMDQNSINNLENQNNAEYPNDNIDMIAIDNLDKCEIFSCQFCSFRTLNLEDASRHMELCNIAQLDTLKNSQQSDIKLVQKDVKRPFECNYCEKKFKFKEELVKHIRIHTGERPYKCRICEKAFSQSSGLSTHLKVHSNIRPFSCSMCERTFKIKSDRDNHEKQHTGLRPYKCDICSKAFMTVQVFSQHKKIHTNERPYKCKACGEAFRRSHVLTVHMLRHSGEKPHACNICLKAYRQRGDLIKHQRIHHADKLPAKAMGKNISHKSSDKNNANPTCQLTL